MDILSVISFLVEKAGQVLPLSWVAFGKHIPGEMLTSRWYLLGFKSEAEIIQQLYVFFQKRTQYMKKCILKTGPVAARLQKPEVCVCECVFTLM